MKNKLLLDEEGIHRSIAKAFGVDRDKVKLEPYTDWEGYGLNEHLVAKVKATVEVPWFHVDKKRTDE